MNNLFRGFVKKEVTLYQKSDLFVYIIQKLNLEIISKLIYQRLIITLAQRFFHSIDLDSPSFFQCSFDKFNKTSI